jgi:hypothetical protein
VARNRLLIELHWWHRSCIHEINQYTSAI